MWNKDFTFISYALIWGWGERLPLNHVHYDVYNCFIEALYQDLYLGTTVYYILSEIDGVSPSGDGPDFMSYLWI